MSASVTTITNSTTDIGHVRRPTGAGPVGLSVSFGSQEWYGRLTKLPPAGSRCPPRPAAATVQPNGGAAADLTDVHVIGVRVSVSLAGHRVAVRETNLDRGERAASGGEAERRGVAPQQEDFAAVEGE